MGEKTRIEWADHSWNGWIGCQKIGPGCDICYAENVARARLGVEWGPHAKRRRTADSTWRLPYRWDRRARAAGVPEGVFFGSLCDWADKAVPVAWQQGAGKVIHETPHLIWLLLTKRISLAAATLEIMFPGGVPSNVRIGSTIVTQKEAERDLPVLTALKKSHDLRGIFISGEPLLEKLWLKEMLDDIDWVIGGGETGGGGKSGRISRPMLLDAIRGLRDQCLESRTPFLMKQWGDWHPWGQTLANGSTNLVSKGKRSGQFLQEGGEIYVRLGKARTGRMLDGVIWDQRPDWFSPVQGGQS